MRQQQEQCYLIVHLHKASASMLRQLSDDASDSVLIEINGDTWKLEVFTNSLQHKNANLPTLF